VSQRLLLFFCRSQQNLGGHRLLGVPPAIIGKMVVTPPEQMVWLTVGSAADNSAIANWKDGVWTVMIIRPLGLTNEDDKPLKEGGVYNVGFAVHDDNITTRGHHVSFVRTLGFGAKANIEAVKLP
jgi:hypothetical protein